MTSATVAYWSARSGAHIRANTCFIVFVGEPAAGRQFKVMKHEVVIGQFLAEPLDRFRFAVILRDTDAMNNCHE